VAKRLFGRDGQKDGVAEMIIGMPERFADSRFDNYRTDTPQQVAALNIARQYVETIREQKGTGLLFMGPIGSGKTRLLLSLMNELEVRYPQSEQMFGNIADLIHRVKSNFGREGYSASDRDIIGRMTEVRLLCIDDLGKEHSTDWTHALTYEIVNKRYNDMARTIFTTNLSRKDLMERYDGAIVSRIMETSTLIDFTGIKDQRMGR
jgi:DNA replication protein DnaC